ncbi:ThiF family adenylyltransferase [Micromonospora radicis]|uniref:ThiF family adenylyltransferase n=2 Tax=Micromonospora radicis TaxID=1894971 RepID=A0A418MSM6_9ACTN|nr:ThiF family adenylyltransferase [Micromonospora radicis]
MAMTTTVATRLAEHLSRSDGQEDLCFLTWRPSTGATRTSAVIGEVIWPERGERLLHGNVSFTSGYFLRAAAHAAETGAGLALVHSHPKGRGWQDLSDDDHAAESGHAAQAVALTGLPLLGLTYAVGDQTYSARMWHRVAARRYTPQWAENVRCVGDRITVSWNNSLRPIPDLREQLTRTVSAWGPDLQASLTRLHVGIIGAGSVGALVAETLARTGVERITLLDFDAVEAVNLDRLLHATTRDVELARSKVETLARALRRSGTAGNPDITALELSVVEPDGLAHALDCDVLFSCVDRPWPRAVLNLAAYAHLIPVVDGGILIRSDGQRMRGAEWRAHMAAPGRACLECLGQYDPADVSLERTGQLDNPSYIAGLNRDHPLRHNENVFAFSMAAAANEALQLLTAVIAPNGIGDVGAHLHHFATGTLDRDEADCNPGCLYSGALLGSADSHGLVVTGRHSIAEASRLARRRAGRRLSRRIARRIDDMLWSSV